MSDDFDFTIFNCKDCGVNTNDIGEFYMVEWDIWAQAHNEPFRHEWLGTDEYFVYRDKVSGMLCIGCLEHRLGRQLRPIDFLDAPINNPALFAKSECIIDRMGVKT